MRCSTNINLIELNGVCVCVCVRVSWRERERERQRKREELACNTQQDDDFVFDVPSIESE
jgi:hypothetical protein